MNIPEDVDLLEGSAGDLLPECLSVLNTGDTIAVVWTADGPASLGDPNPLSRRDFIDNVSDLVDCAPEGVARVLDTASFEVRVCVWN